MDPGKLSSAALSGMPPEQSILERKLKITAVKEKEKERMIADKFEIKLEIRKVLEDMRKMKKLEEFIAKIIFRQIIEGLGYIHRKRILHRDIKLDNILLDGKGNVKIADFGVSKLVKLGDVMHEQSGTPAYIAPEILRE